MKKKKAGAMSGTITHSRSKELAQNRKHPKGSTVGPYAKCDKYTGKKPKTRGM